MWFYLNGSHPRRGGVCVIADSHRLGWTGPEGFEFTGDELKRGTGGQSFRRPGADNNQNYPSFDVPGCVPIVADPGDMIVWAPRTYHAAFPLLDSWADTRHSANFGLRAQPGVSGAAPEVPTLCPWPRSRAALELESSIAPELRRYFAHYPGYPTAGWKDAVLPRL